MSFEPYKPTQAKSSRTLVMLTGWFLIVWGAVALYVALSGFTVLGQAWNQFETFGAASRQDAWTVDLFLFQSPRPFGPAMTIAALVGAVGAFWWWRFSHKPKWADLLIEMEVELRKVSWPTPGDAWQSTLVVTGFTVALVVTIVIYDLVISKILQLFTAVA